MAENDVRVVGIDDRAKQVLNDFGWATESTLAKLAGNSQISMRLLQQIARNKGMSESAMSSMQKSADQVAKTASDGAKELDGAVNKLSQGINNIGKDSKTSAKEAIDQIGKLGASGSSKIGSAAEKTQSLLGKIAGGIKGIFTGDAGNFEKVISDAGRGIKSWASSFQPSGIVGKVLSGMVGMFGSLVSAVGTATGALRSMNDEVRKVFAAGIAPEGGFESLAKTAMATGMTMQEVTKTLTEFGAVTSTLGTKRMLGLQAQMAKQTRLGAEFMMTQQELQQAFGDSMEMMRISGELRGSTDEQINARGARTITLFNDLSQATGKNRDELRKATAELMKSTKQFGLMRSAGKGSGEAIQGLMASLTAEFGSSAGQVAEMVEGMFMGGPALVDEAMRPLLAIVPGFGKELEDITQGIKSGALDPKQAAQRMCDIIDNIDESSLKTLRAANPALYQTVRQMQLNNQQARESREKEAQMTAEERAQRDRDIAAAKNRQEAFNKMDAAMNTLRTAFNMFLAKAVEPLMPVFKKVAEILTKVTEKVTEKFTAFLQNIDWDQKTKQLEEWLDGFKPEDVISTISGMISSLFDLAGHVNSVTQWFAKITGLDPGAAFLSVVAGGALVGIVATALLTGGVQAVITKLIAGIGGSQGKTPANPLFVEDVSKGLGGRGPGGPGQTPGQQDRRGPPGPRTPGGGRFGRLFGTAMTAMSFYQMMEGFMPRGGMPANLPGGDQTPAAPSTEAPMSGGTADQSLLAKTTEMISGNAGLIAGAVDMLSGLAPVANLGGMAGKAANLLKSPGAIVASVIGGLTADALKESGYEKSGAAADILTDALSFGSTGALLGSFIPGLGTAIGAGVGTAAGGAYGLYKNWDTLFGTKSNAVPPEVAPQPGPPPIDIREIERTVAPLQDTTVKDLNEEFDTANQQNQQSMDKLLDAIVSQMEVQRETNRRLEDGFRRMSDAIEDASPRM
jgi:hypothetical protein